MLRGGGREIAVIDDDDGLRSLLAALLERHGFFVSTYSNGNQFLRADRGTEVTVILSDVDMADGDGFDVVSYASRARIPVVLVTGLPDGAELEAARSAGAAAVLRKPVAPSTLWRVLAQTVPVLSETHP